jgi:hypothetical protein
VESLAQSTSSPILPQQLPPSMNQPTSQQIAQDMPEHSGIDLIDIHLPEQINDFPIAMGWWILAAMVIFTVIYLVFKYRGYVKTRVNQKNAMAKMSLKPSIDESIKILKWAAMQYFPRHKLANLYGEKFQQFLLNNLALGQQEKFKSLSSPAFASLYKNDQINKQTNEQDMTEQLNQASLLWLKNALPPRKIVANKNKEKNND